MIAKARAARPPPPMPWTARKAASWYIVVASPHSSEPTRKIVIADMYSFLRP